MDINQKGRYKFFLTYLVGIGVAPSQQDIGRLIGYTNPSSFSQIITGKKPMPREFNSKLKSIYPNLNVDWLETGEGEMLLQPDTTYAKVQTQDNGTSGQQFNGPILGDNPQFAGHDLTNNNASAADFDKFIVTLTAQADLTKEAHELTRNAQAQVDKAQSQIDRLLTMLEVKFNITPATV